MNVLFRMTSDSGHFVLPGLEVYNAIQYAKDNHVDIFWGESVLGNKAINALKNEKRMNFLDIGFRFLFLNNQVGYWNTEYNDLLN